MIAPSYALNQLILKGMHRTYDELVSEYDFKDYAFSKLRERYKAWTGNSMEEKLFDSFEMRDDHGKQTSLTVSGQLEGELGATALGAIYTFGPTFRAENSNTPRHLAEFWMVEPEVAFLDMDGLMELEEDFIKYCIRWALDNCKDDLAFVPTIAVTYDVILKDEKGKTVTRQDVTSTIILGNKYFETLNPAQTAAIYNINILIQPRYLYVLADQDAYTGHLLIQ